MMTNATKKTKQVIYAISKTEAVTIAQRINNDKSSMVKMIIGSIKKVSVISETHKLSKYSVEIAAKNIIDINFSDVTRVRTISQQR